MFNNVKYPSKKTIIHKKNNTEISENKLYIIDVNTTSHVCAWYTQLQQTATDGKHRRRGVGGEKTFDFFILFFLLEEWFIPVLMGGNCTLDFRLQFPSISKGKLAE